MKRNEVVNINKEYLREIVSRSGFDQLEFSRRIGRYDRYVKNCLYTGRMDENAAKLVCSMFNRDEKKLIIREEPEVSGLDLMQGSAEVQDIKNGMEAFSIVFEQRMNTLEKKINAISIRLGL